MPFWLLIWLIVMGLGTLIVISMPWLVILGFFLLIVPGIILAIIPTVFLWSCVFALFFVPLSSKIPGLLAGIIAIAATIAIMLAIPQFYGSPAREALTRFRLESVKADKPIRLSGDIRLETGFPRWDNANAKALGFRPFSCDNRCLALLFEPGVTSVTMGSTVGLTFDQIAKGEIVDRREARTYRLRPIAQCGDLALKPDLEGWVGQFGATLEDNRAMAGEWQQKLSSELCLTGEPPIARLDFLVRTGDWSADKTSTRDWSLSQIRSHAPFGEIRDGKGIIVHRDFHLSVTSLAAPLHIMPDGGMESFRFKWGRKTRPKGRVASWEDPVKAVDAALDVTRTVNLDRAKDGMRVQLKAALANPILTADAPVFQSIENYMALLEKVGARDEDRDVITRLIADPRLHDLNGSWLLPKLFDDAGLAQLTPVIIAKLASLPETVKPGSVALGHALDKWPAGAFAKPTPAMFSLLDNVQQRRQATGLIRRLSDMGGAAAPRLTRIIDEHQRAGAMIDRDDPSLPRSERDYGFSAHRTAAGAAIEALCKMGPTAQAQLPALEAISVRAGAKGFERRGWDRMLVRLGKPVEQISKPQNLSGSEENYRKNLRYFLDRFDPERSCS